MDDVKRGTLLLIRRGAMVMSSKAEVGRQLILCVRDYVEDGDLAEARATLREIHPDYFADFMFSQAVADKSFGEAVASIIDELGHGFWLFGREPAGTT